MLRTFLRLQAFGLLVSGARAAFGPHNFNTDNITSLTGEWSSGYGGVRTGQTFANPVNFTFNVPATTGIAFAFTDDGNYEMASYQYVSNPASPNCIQAVLIFQHGNYTFQSNGSITTTNYAADGRIEVQDTCAATTTVMSYYNEPGLYPGWSIVNDLNHNQYCLQMYAFDGSPMARMYLVARPANMYPSQQLTTDATVEANSELNGVISAAGDSLHRIGALGLAGAGLLGLLAWAH